MKRRTFLATVPGVLGLAGGVGGGSSSASLSLIAAGSPHPRVLGSIDELAGDLRRLGHTVNVVSGNAQAAAGGRRVIIGVLDGQTRRELKNAGLQSDADLAPEHYQLASKSGVVFVLGGDARGVVYAICELRRMVAQQGALPEAISIRRGPHFPVRRWGAAVTHCFGSPWDERANLAQRFSYIKTHIVPRALEFGMNSLELYGRPEDSWDIDWMIGFEKYPELAALYPTGERRQRLLLVEDLARTAHDHLLDLLVWSHELHLPPGFTGFYPQVKGTGYPVCLSSDFLKQFIRDKYREFFAAAPSVDGLVLSVNESGDFSLLTDAGCRCSRCVGMTQHDRLSAVLREVLAVASELNKQVVLRTFQSSFTRDLHGHPEMETIRKAYTGLPKNVQVMSKYCPLDFYGGAIADEPLIGAFPNPHLVEFSLDVEWQGRTFVPALTAENFRRRVAHAVEKRCAGIVARVDFPFPSMEPETIFGHPNEFNARYMGELAWDPATDLDASLRNWCALRYGQQAGPILAGALRKTEEITQKTFFALGQTVINYHNMVAAVSACDNNLWGHALSKWDRRMDALSLGFFEPDEDLIARCAAEKRRAIELADNALGEMLDARGKLPELEFQRLRYLFEKLRDTAELWGHLLELYLRHRQIASSPARPDRVQRAISEMGKRAGPVEPSVGATNESRGSPQAPAAADRSSLARLFEAARAVLGKAVMMERLHGANSWPVMSPDRGVSAYEFANQVLRHYVAGVTGESVRETELGHRVNEVYTTPLYEPGSVESFWRALVELGRPGVKSGSERAVVLKWPEQLRDLVLDGLDCKLTSSNGVTVNFPLSFPVRRVVLSRGTATTNSITKAIQYLVVSQSESK